MFLFCSHVEKYTTREDPRHDPDYVEPPKPRDVELIRDPDKGFGFVAGSEKPVVVRFVTDGKSIYHTASTTEGARCSSVVGAVAHGAMGRWIDPSW